ncbi:MAG: hypothetical protein JWQ88_2231, partial [Rhodoferax sp.]|nr:hypothetical protein [Rhodoferax sp.]
RRGERRPGDDMTAAAETLAAQVDELNASVAVFKPSLA